MTSALTLDDSIFYQCLDLTNCSKDMPRWFAYLHFSPGSNMTCLWRERNFRRSKTNSLWKQKLKNILLSTIGRWKQIKLFGKFLNPIYRCKLPVKKKRRNKKTVQFRLFRSKKTLFSFSKCFVLFFPYKENKVECSI